MSKIIQKLLMDRARELYRELFMPAGLMAALIIGAGVFSLPYIFSVSGVWLGFAYLAVFALVFSAIHLMYADVIKHTPGDHRFVGYAKIHLGRWGFGLSLLTTLVGIILVLLIYLVLSVNFTKAILPALNEQYVFLGFWGIFSATVILGIERVAKLDMFLTALKLLIIVVVFALGVSQFDLNNFTPNPSAVALPFSAVLFSLSGRSAISSIREHLKKNKISDRKMSAAMVLGTFVPAILYALFVVGVLGISGSGVTADSIAGIASAFHWGGAVIAFLAMLSLWTAYTFLGFEADNILIRDLKVPVFWSGIVIVLAPVVLYFLGFDNFLKLIGISCGVLLAIESIMVAAMWRKVAKPKPLLYWAAYGIMLVFMVGGTYEIISLLPV